MEAPVSGFEGSNKRTRRVEAPRAPSRWRLISVSSSHSQPSSVRTWSSVVMMWCGYRAMASTALAQSCECLRSSMSLALTSEPEGRSSSQVSRCLRDIS
jgi:hypothetical protein